MLTGCGHKYDISPNKLPEAHVGKSYTQFDIR